MKRAGFSNGWTCVSRHSSSSDGGRYPERAFCISKRSEAAKSRFVIHRFFRFHATLWIRLGFLNLD